MQTEIDEGFRAPVVKVVHHCQNNWWKENLVRIDVKDRLELHEPNLPFHLDTVKIEEFNKKI